MPLVDHLSVEDEETNTGFDLSRFVRNQIGEEWAMIAQDIAKNSDILDEFDFKPGGKFYNHEEVQEMDAVVKAIQSGDEELLKELGITSYDSKDFIKRLYKDLDDDDQDKS